MGHQESLDFIPSVFVFCLCLIGTTLCASIGEQTIRSKAILVSEKAGEINHKLLDVISSQRDFDDLNELDDGLIIETNNDDDHQDNYENIPEGQLSSSQLDSNQKRESTDVKNLLRVANATTLDVNQTQLNLTVNELELPFLSLFDELWRIKNSTAIALVKLDYLQLNETTTLTNANETNGKSNQTEASDFESEDQPNNCTLGSCGHHLAGQQLPVKRLGPLELVGSIKKQNQAALIKQQSSLANVMNQFNGWFAKLQRRVQELMERLYGVLVGRLIRHQPLVRAQLVGNSSDDINGIFSKHTELDQRASTKKKRQTTDEIDSPKGLPELESTDDSGNRGETHRNNLDATVDADCINLTIDEELRCKSTETLIESTLNHSFPGTVMSIETNCAHVTFLLATCWPQQLQQLKISIASWNETLITLTEFPLPIGSEEEHNRNHNEDQQQNQRQTNSCGFKDSKSNQTIKDRVNWMWLNLCLDRKFRQDYLDNLKCLSLWSQERAQQVCSHEYKRMQAYLVTQSEAIGGQLTEQAANKSRLSEDKRRGENHSSDQFYHHQQQLQHENSHHVSDLDNFGGGLSIMDHLSSRGPFLNGTGSFPSRLGDSKSQPTALNGQTDLAQVEREVSSKMLCCMFDQFLRCVNRQAIRDCGRTGAQFVVNFMSRIGTDDMKYLCNSESRATPTGSTRGPPMATTGTSTASHKQSSSGGSRRTNNHHHHHHHMNDKGPFIENNYCSDPKIQNALFGLMGAQHSGENRNKPYVNSNSHSWQGHQVGGRGRTRNQLINVNHDPTFFGTELVADSAHWSARHSIRLTFQTLVCCLLFTLPSLILIIVI